jgi:3-dehydrosphinganine reductase
METRLCPKVPIEVHLVLPNFITTAGYKRENETKPQITLQLEGADNLQDPEVLARLSIAGFEKGDYFPTTSVLGDLMRWGAMGNSPRND